MSLEVVISAGIDIFVLSAVFNDNRPAGLFINGFCDDLSILLLNRFCIVCIICIYYTTIVEIGNQKRDIVAGKATFRKDSIIITLVVIHCC